MLGQDVLLLASYGYDAWGLDVSETAVENAKKLASDKQRVDQQYPVRNTEHGRGQASFVLANFFTGDFLPQTNGSHFDVIFDYTFLCALPPELRPQWAKRMSELLSPHGRLICLEFPLDKAPSSGGPPHGLSSSLYEQLFKAPGSVPKYNDDGKVIEHGDQESAADALVRVAHWRPERSHSVSQGKDMMSIWKHREE